MAIWTLLPRLNSYPAVRAAMPRTDVAPSYASVKSTCGAQGPTTSLPLDLTWNRATVGGPGESAGRRGTWLAGGERKTLKLQPGQRERAHTGRAHGALTNTGQLQIGDVAERSKASILRIEHEGSNPSFTAEQTGLGARNRAHQPRGLRYLNNDRVVQRDQDGPRDAHALGIPAAGRRATRAASPSLPRRAAAGRWPGGLPSGRRSEPPDA